MSDFKKILITSCFARGGVVSMRNMAARFLRDGGMQVDFASYAPYQLFKDLSVPIWRTTSRAPGLVMQENHWWVGTWLPEWEFMRSRVSNLWQQIFSQYQNHLVVSGTAMAANPLLESGIRPLCWLATPYWDERSIHVKQFSFVRKLMTMVDKPLCEKQERHVLNSTPILALGNYTLQRFRAIAPQGDLGMLAMPVENKDFYPPANKQLNSQPRIGFCGRLEDPRKNIEFLLRSFKHLKSVMPKVQLVLVGGQLSSEQKELMIELELDEKDVEVISFIPRDQLVKFYHSLDLFVIPSHQEGLAIVGLEAMACGLPVVSTVCGGPQDYVYDGENGHLVHFAEREMSNAIVDILGDKTRWKQFSDASIQIVQEDYNYQTLFEEFWNHFNNKGKANPAKKTAA